MKAIWRDTVIAESDDTVYLEGNHYFPAESVDFDRLEPNRMRSVCFWKGIARYYSIEVGDEKNVHAAWTYHHPFPWIRKIRDAVAFWNGVEIRP